MRPIDADELQEYLTDLLLNCESWINSTTDEEILTIVKANYKSFLEVLSHVKDTPTLEDIPQWIPCEERLPKEYGLYLAAMNDGSVQECSYVPTDYGDVLLNGWSTCEASGFKVLNKTDVLAWMPLPEPYKKERKNDE